MTTGELSWFKSSYSSGGGGECLEAAYTWRKSTHSSGEGGQCLEVGYTWRKSTHSDGGGGQCLEVAACPGTVHVRDSKNPAGPRLDLSPSAWGDFLAYARQ